MCKVVYPAKMWDTESWGILLEVGGGLQPLTGHPFVLWLRVWEQRTCSQAAISTLALLHPCIRGCMKYSVWEEVGRRGERVYEWGRSQVLHQTVDGKVSHPAVEGKPVFVVALPPQGSCFHFSVPHFAAAINPSICAQGLAALWVPLISLCNLFSTVSPEVFVWQPHTHPPPSEPFSSPHSPPLCLATFRVHLLSHLHFFRFLVTRNISCQRAVGEDHVVEEHSLDDRTVWKEQVHWRWACSL